MNTKDNLRRQLRIARSDLADCTNPKVLEKYPHLGTEENIQQCRERVKWLEQQWREA